MEEKWFFKLSFFVWSTIVKKKKKSLHGQKPVLISLNIKQPLQACWSSILQDQKGSALTERLINVVMIALRWTGEVFDVLSYLTNAERIVSWPCVTGTRHRTSTHIWHWLKCVQIKYQNLVSNIRLELWTCLLILWSDSSQFKLLAASRRLNHRPHLRFVQRFK